MLESFEMSDTIPASPQAIYDAWLDGDRHSALTGGAAASADARPGGQFSAWDGYIYGTFTAFEPGQRIVMAWRTTEFPEDAADSRLEVLLEPAPGGTKVTFHHSDIPEGQGDNYRQGWIDFYYTPMKEHFAK